MFYDLHTIWQFALAVFGLAALGGLGWRWPRWSALVIIFLAPAYLLKIGGLPLTLLEAMLWVFIFVWLAKKIKNKESWPEIEKKYFLALGLILLGLVLSAVFSPEPRVGFGIIKSWFLAPMVFSFALADIFKERSDLRRVFGIIFISSIAVASVALIYLFSGFLTYDGRLTAFYLSPNHLAMWLAPGAILGLIFWFGASKPRRVLLSIAYCLLFVPLYFTYSYGAWLGLGAAAIFVIFYIWRFKIVNYCYLRIICGLFLFFFFAIAFLQSGSEKITSLVFSDRSSWESRLMVWRAAGEVLKDNWLLGIGPGLFQKYYLAYQQYFPPYLEWAVPQPHNLFLAWWLQAGLVGLAGFIWLMAIFFRRSFNFLAETKSPPAILLMAVMIYFLIHGLIDTPVWKNDLALIFWIIVFLGSRVARRVYW